MKHIKNYENFESFNESVMSFGSQKFKDAIKKLKDLIDKKQDTLPGNVASRKAAAEAKQKAIEAYIESVRNAGDLETFDEVLAALRVGAKLYPKEITEHELVRDILNEVVTKWKKEFNVYQEK